MLDSSGCGDAAHGLRGHPQDKALVCQLVTRVPVVSALVMGVCGWRAPVTYGRLRMPPRSAREQRLSAGKRGFDSPAVHRKHTARKPHPRSRPTEMRRSGFLKRGTPLKTRGKRAYTPPSPDAGPCEWGCGYWGPLANDHILPRSIFYGPELHTRANLQWSCWACNYGREMGQYPSWDRLRPSSRELVLREIGAERAKRYFTNVPH